MIGKRLGDYEILREIGQGGQGDIYLAKNVHLPDVLVVLKILKSQGQKERFLREATTLAKLEHKNICQMKHFFSHEHNLILVVQYLAGQTLKDFIANNQSADLRKIQSIFVQVLDAIIYAHNHGVTHRDIKPSNIMIDENGVVKIIDFGIARDIADPRLTVTGTSTGTPQYMAPEQFTESRISDFTRCDIYSTGVSLYEACCGVLPFVDTNPYVLKEKHCKEDPVSPSKYNREIHNTLEKVILTAMRKKPGKRYSSAEAMKHALLQASIYDATETKVVVSNRWRARITVWSAVVTAGMALALLGYVYWPQIGSYLYGQPEFTIASETINEGETFSPIRIDSLVQIDSTLAGAIWRFHGLNELTIDSGQGVLRILQPGDDWYGSETINVVVSKRNGTIDSTTVQFTVLNLNDKPRISGRLGESINEGESFAPIQLGALVSDIDDSDSSIVWNWGHTRHLNIRRDSSGRLIVTAPPNWSGSENLALVASDRSGASDTLSGRFEVRPLPPEPKPTEPVASAEEAASKSAQHEVRLRVRPEGCIIRDNTGREYRDLLRQQLEDGTYTYSVYSKSYPIKKVKVRVSSQAVDTTIDLNGIYAGSEQATLGVAVWKSGEVIPCRVFLNLFDTGKLSTDGLSDLISGSYLIDVNLEDGLKVDSLLFDRKPLEAGSRYITLEPGVKNIVAFFISAKD